MIPLHSLSFLYKINFIYCQQYIISTSLAKPELRKKAKTNTNFSQVIVLAFAFAISFN